MQNKNQSKSKLQHYFSVKDYDNVKDNLKKNKLNNTKSNNKKKGTNKIQKSNSKNKIKNERIIKNNQNFNSINVYGHQTSRPKNLFQNQINKKQANSSDYRLKRHSNERLARSKSTGRINIKVQRRTMSPSPIPLKQPHFIQEEKMKITKNQTSRSQKQKKQTINKTNKEDICKLKKSGSKLTINFKHEIIDRPIITSNRTSNRISVKTEISSKTHSVMRQDNKNKKPNTKNKNNKIKKTKNQQQKQIKLPNKNHPYHKNQSIVQKSILYSQVSFQDCNAQCPYQSAILSNQKYFLPYPQLKTVKTQGCQIETKQQYKLNFKGRNQAALKIQKVFRGFITRKYIDQAKYIISKVKIIQNWWRKILSTHKSKQQHNNKRYSHSNSLITIKDFNQTLSKPQKQKPQIQQSTSKINIKQLIKNILQQNEQQSLNKSHNIKQLLSKTPSQSSINYNKQQYIQVKIKDEILSQRKFNSPKNNSPCSFVNTPTNTFNIKEYFSSNIINSNEKNKLLKQIIQSPKLTSPLLKSPNNKITSPLSIKKNNQPYQCSLKLINDDDYQPFQTNFTAIQEICLYLVDYFKVKEEEMQLFIGRLEELKYFKSNLVFKYWNSYKLYPQQNDQLSQMFPPPDYQYLETYEKPILFPQELRDDIIKFPQIEIQLNNKRYNLDSKTSATINKSFLSFIFDALQEAFYEPYKHIGLKYGQSLDKNIYKSKKDLFQRYLCCALGHLFSWGQVLCGLMPDIYSDQEKIRQERMSIFEKRFDLWDLGVSSHLGIKLQITFLIFEELMEQIEEQMQSFL